MRPLLNCVLKRNLGGLGTGHDRNVTRNITSLLLGFVCVVLIAYSNLLLLGNGAWRRDLELVSKYFVLDEKNPK